MNKTNQITDINTLQFIRKLRNFLHIISIQSNYSWAENAGWYRATSGFGRISLFGIFDNFCIYFYSIRL